MTVTLLIARHGNTFEKNEVPRRIGKNTDLPLVSSGILQAKALALYLKAQGLMPSRVFTSPLKRTRETANLIAPDVEIINDARFSEIDYGVDENKSEADVIARIGKSALKAWDTSAIVPEGWRVDPDSIIKMWLTFGKECATFHDETILVVTSNGIARFAPYLTGNFEEFNKTHDIKIATGALCILNYEKNKWLIVDWNIRL